MAYGDGIVTVVAEAATNRVASVQPRGLVISGIPFYVKVLFTVIILQTPLPLKASKHPL